MIEEDTGRTILLHRPGEFEVGRNNSQPLRNSGRADRIPGGLHDAQFSDGFHIELMPGLPGTMNPDGADDRIRPVKSLAQIGANFEIEGGSVMVRKTSADGRNQLGRFRRDVVEVNGGTLQFFGLSNFDANQFEKMAASSNIGDFHKFLFNK